MKNIGIKTEQHKNKNSYDEDSSALYPLSSPLRLFRGSISLSQGDRNSGSLYML
jgi:hypothetical protein